MGKARKLINFDAAVIELYKLLEENPLLPALIPLLILVWAVEKWIFSVSNWVLLVLAVWATLQHGNHQRRILVENLNKKWMQLTLQTSDKTPLEHCEWLNKLFIEVWPNYIQPSLSQQFASLVERRLRHQKSRFIEKIQLLEFSLGSRPPLLGLHGTYWATSGDQRIMRISFDWDADDVNVLMFAKLAKPFGTAKIVVNSIHLKGHLLVIPILEGNALIYSFISTPEIRLGVAFGSGGSQSLPATELPGVSSWLVKLATDTMNKRMVEPRRNCLALPALNLHKKAVGGVLYVTGISAENLLFSKPLEDTSTDDHIETFLEVELEELIRKTDSKPGASPKWDSTFHLMLHSNTGILRFNAYKCTPGNPKCDLLASCEIKLRYVGDDSTIFWAIGANSSVIARRAEVCGKEVEMTVPFEGATGGELTVKMMLKEWHYSDGSRTFTTTKESSLHSNISSKVSKTGRRIYVTVVEGQDFPVKDKLGKSDPYVKLQYGKTMKRTESAPRSSKPTWNQRFEFDEEDGEYLKIKCYTEEMFSDESFGRARVNLEGLADGCIRDVWIPLEKSSSGELQLRLEARNLGDHEQIKGSSNGWIELVLIEARDLVAADLRGTSDPYVKIQYGNMKRTTKVVPKTLNPKWHQTLEFPDNGSQLTLTIKDHNALLPETTIGDCVVDYQTLPPNKMIEKWIPLKGVKRGEINIQITRREAAQETRSHIYNASSMPSQELQHQISDQIKEMLMKMRSQMDDDDFGGLSQMVTELEILQDSQDEYIAKLETEQKLMIDKINQLGQEIFHSAAPLQRVESAP